MAVPGNAVGDVGDKVGVGAAVIEHAGGERGPAAAFPAQAVAFGAMRAKDFGAGGHTRFLAAGGCSDSE